MLCEFFPLRIKFIPWNLTNGEPEGELMCSGRVLSRKKAISFKLKDRNFLNSAPQSNTRLNLSEEATKAPFSRS